MQFLNTILDLVFPARCISCGKSGTELCALCLSDAPMAERETDKWIFPFYDYRHPVIKKSLWLLKYSGKKRLAKIFAENIYGKMMEELSELSMLENFHNAILIPIPLSKKRYRERGFNQAQLICEELVKISKRNHLTPPLAPLYFPRRGAGGEVFTLEKNILIKTKDTEHQARIKDRSVRLKNLAGTFAIKNPEQNAEFLKGKNIILIDDITTTGATLNEARRILKSSGARKIIAFTVAH
jgi:competence protein ComFC